MTGASRRTWFTADLHFGHRGILATGRPWDDVEAMADDLVARWNARRARTAAYMARLNGTKYLVRGNHDSRQTAAMFEWSKDYHRLKLPDADGLRGAQRIVLCHYPLLVWDQMHYGTWHLHG